MIKPDDIALFVKEANKTFHDQESSCYESHHSDIFNPQTQQRIAEILAWIRTKSKGECLLDAGCGTGNILNMAGVHFGERIGVDISPGMCREARANNPLIVCADLEFLPLPANYFDVAASFSVLHHLYEHEAYYREVYRILKPGGYLYTDHDPNLLNVATCSGKAYNKLYRLISGLSAKPDKSGKEKSDEDGDVEGDLVRYVEYHHQIKKGLDPRQLKESLLRVGFREVKIIYHDDFSSLSISKDRRWKLRMIIRLFAIATLHFNSSFLPNFLILAQK
jgi:ubiquinone/menaquinone biosynthesis C-methylase UbiE